MIIFSVLIVLLHFGVSHEADCNPSATTVIGSKAKQGQTCSGELLFEEKFDNLDESVWNHELLVNGAGNNEFEQYVNDRSISYTQDGKLFIKPKIVGDAPMHDGFFNPVQSARLTTSGKFAFKYGRLEAKAQTPSGDWLWPAIWLLPQNNKYGNWPTSGEIDILESRGNKNLVSNGANIGTQLVFSTLHWGKSPNENLFSKTHWEKRSPAGYDTGYHKYLVEWTPDYMAFKVDDQEIGRVTPPNGGFYEYGGLQGNNPWGGGSKMAPFDQEFFIIINLAVGGTNDYFPDSATNPNGKPWKNGVSQAEGARNFWNGNAQWRPTWNEQTTQCAFKIDYVKVWAL